MKKLGNYVFRRLLSESRYIPCRMNGNDQYEIRVATEYDAAECSYVFSDIFANSTEPVCTSLGFSLEEFKGFLDICMAEDFKEGLSCVALKNDEIVGSLYAHEFDFSGHVPQEVVDFVETSYNWQVVFDFLDDLEDQYIQYCEENGRSKCIHSFMGVVKPEHYGNNLLQNMMEYVIDIGRERGYEALFGEATSYFSQKKNEHFKATIVAESLYKEYTYEGVHVFKDAKEDMIEKLKKKDMYREELKDLYCEGTVLYEILI